MEIAGEENLILDWADEAGKERLIEREEEPWREDWRAFEMEEEKAEPLGALGAALLAALGETDDEVS